MKYTEPRPYSDPEVAARRLMEHACRYEPLHDSRIYIEKINGPFFSEDKGTVQEYSAGMKLCIDRGWLVMHESGDLGPTRRSSSRASPGH